MGRDVYTSIRDKDHAIVWSSVELCEGGADYDNISFCGRDDCTDVIAHFAYGNEDDEIDVTKKEDYDMVEAEIREMMLKREREMSRDALRIDDLRKCRGNAVSLRTFYDFDEALTDAQRDFDERYWDKARDMLKLMRKTRCKLQWYEKTKPEGAPYSMYWVLDE